VDTIIVTYTSTGEVRKFQDASMMVASNGVIFIKQGKRTVFASGSTDIIVEVA